MRVGKLWFFYFCFIDAISFVFR